MLYVGFKCLGQSAPVHCLIWTFIPYLQNQWILNILTNIEGLIRLSRSYAGPLLFAYDVQRTKRALMHFADNAGLINFRAD